MFSENSGLFTAIIIISLIFLIICLSLIFIVVLYNQRRRLHVEEKKEMSQKFEAELLKTHIEVQEQTMQTIAADLHDSIGQLLSLTTLTLNSIDIQQPKKAEKKVSDSLVLVNKSIKELRELAKLLHGEQVITSGLGNALQQELNWLKKTGAYKLKVNNELRHLNLFSTNKDLIILRLLQEIFNNIIKHAQASQIEMNAYLLEGKLNLQVIEDGIGFNYKKVQQEQSGMGLQSIQKRVEMINGNMDIDSVPQKGTSITITIPYP